MVIFLLKTTLDPHNPILDYADMRTLKEIMTTFKESGFKAVARKYGWKLFLVVFVYYLIRDVTIYIVIPYLIYQGFAGQS
jgi:hypothetical protein